MSQYFTLLDYAKRTDTEGGLIPKFVEMMNVSGAGDLIKSLMVKPTNLVNEEKIIVRTGLPEIFLSQFGEGWGHSKSDTEPVSFGCGEFRGRSMIDKRKLTDLPDGEKVYMTEVKAQLEAMAQKLATAFFYGNKDINKKEFTGLANYYSSTSAKSSKNLILLDGTSESENLTSIYLTVYSDNTIYGIFPKATKAGIVHESKPDVLDTDESGNENKKLWYAVDEYSAKMGLCVADWRYGGRIANIDIQKNLTVGDTVDISANILTKMMFLKNRVPNINAGRAIFHMNTDMYSILEAKLLNAISHSTLAYKDLADGRTILTAFGLEISKCDSILNTESLVS